MPLNWKPWLISGILTGPAYADRQLIEIAASLVPEDRPREFNLALLDIAAAVCRPKNPSCSLCPLVEMCAFACSTRHEE